MCADYSHDGGSETQPEPGIRDRLIGKYEPDGTNLEFWTLAVVWCIVFCVTFTIVSGFFCWVVSGMLLDLFVNSPRIEALDWFLNRTYIFFRDAVLIGAGVAAFRYVIQLQYNRSLRSHAFTELLVFLYILNVWSYLFPGIASVDSFDLSYFAVGVAFSIVFCLLETVAFALPVWIALNVANLAPVTLLHPMKRLQLSVLAVILSLGCVYLGGYVKLRSDGYLRFAEVVTWHRGLGRDYVVETKMLSRNLLVWWMFRLPGDMEMKFGSPRVEPHVPDGL